MTETVTVRWYVCSCPWITKVCDEEHLRFARVPIALLEQFERFPSRAEVSAETIKGVPEVKRGR